MKYTGHVWMPLAETPNEIMRLVKFSVYNGILAHGIDMAADARIRQVPTRDLYLGDIL